MSKLKQGWSTLCGVVGKVSKKTKVAAVTGALTLVGTASSHAADLVTIDSNTGMPTFNAQVVFSPMITTIVGIVGAASAIWITLAGIGFIKRFMKG
jgi:hypothetical protein